MKIGKLLCKVIALFLCCVTLIQCIPQLSQAETTEIVAYVRDIKLIYAKNESDAAKMVPEGYILYKQNINEGTDGLGVYICYSVTTDKNLAITDIRVMNESAGFDRGTFNDKMDQAIEALDEQAGEIYKAITDEFIPNYNAKLPGAVYAHSQLNIFMFNETEALGDYIVSGKLTKQDISKMMLVCHNLVLSAVFSLIAQGLQRPDGEDWLDKLEEMDPADYENNITLQKEYAELIDKIQPALNQFSDQYNIMVYTDDVRNSMTAEQVELYSEDLSDEETINWWYSLWDILNAHPLAGDSGLTAESILVEWYLGESVANHKVCMLIDSLSPGQRSLLSLIGPINLIFSDLFTEEKRLEAEKGLAEIKNEHGTISLWDGVDMDIFTNEVGITSVAYDEMVTSDNYDIFTAEKSVLSKTTEDYISLVTYYSSLISGAFTTVSAVAMLAKGYAGKVIIFKAFAKLGALLAKTLIGTIFSYATMVVLGICLLATLIIWIVKEVQANKPPEHERTTIPKYMVDSITDTEGVQRYEIYKRIDNVQSDDALKNAEAFDLGDVKNLNGADINGCQGYNWAAIYVSSSESAGNPIEAEFRSSKFIGAAPDGYIGLRHFNKKSEVVNLNAVDEYNSTDDELYLYYKSEKLPDDHRVYKYVHNISVVNVGLRDPRNPDLFRLSTDEGISVAKKELTELGYSVIDYNFSDNADVVTMIGWSGTDKAEDAVKDIRLVKNSSVGRASSGKFGTMSYGNIGDINGWSLFVSRGDQNPAPPVTMLKVVKNGESPSDAEGISLCINGKESTVDTTKEPSVTVGWEPANEFTGGNAVPLGDVGVQLYFMPETPFVSGPDYLAGVKTDAYIYNYSYDKGSYSAFGSGGYSCNHVDIWNNNYDEYRAYKEQNFGEKFFDDSINEAFGDMSATVSYYDEHVYSANHPDCPYNDENGWTSYERLPPHSIMSVKYYTTKNPYRAIYGVASRTTEGKQYRDSFVNYADYGYALAPSEITVSLANLVLDEFGYEEIIKTGKSFVGKTHVLEDRPYRSTGIVVNHDITQFVHSTSNLTFNGLYVTGYTGNRTPLTAEDFMFSGEILTDTAYPESFAPIPYMGGDGTEYTILSPINERVSAKYPGYSASMKAVIYKPLYGYVRSEMKTTDSVTSYMPGVGEYVSKLYLTSKEEIRVTSLLSNNPDAECKNITYSMLKSDLINNGATTVYSTGIGTDYYSGGDDDANTVYLGISRTDDADKAIRDIRFHVCEKGEEPAKNMTVTIKKDGKEYTVSYELADSISLTSKANLECVKTLNGKGIEVWQEKELYEERQAYLYVTYNSTAFPDPITDISINEWCTNAQNEPLLNFEGKSLYTVKNESLVNLHITDEWFEEGTIISFRRSSNNKKYVSEVAVRNGDDRLQIISSLVEEGYSVVNLDLNKNAAGDHIYIGVRYTDNENDAITNILTIHQKNPYASYSVTDERHIYNRCSDIDLNKGAGGDYIYIYATKDPRAGAPLLELYGSDGVKEFTDSLYKHSTVQRLWDFKHSNLNAGTTVFTSNVYLVMRQKTDSGKYISDVYVAYGWSKDGAVSKLRENGFYEYIDKDLNAGTESTQYIYLGYKRTDDPDKAITNIMMFLYGDEKAEISFDGINYTLSSNVNLNRHCSAFSADIFLYYTKDKNAGDPITSLYCSSEPVNNRYTELGYHRTAKSAGSGTSGNSDCDLNRGALGDNIYLVMTSQSSSTLVSSLFGNGSWLVIGIVGLFFLLCIAVALIHRYKKEKLHQLWTRISHVFRRRS